MTLQETHGNFHSFLIIILIICVDFDLRVSVVTGSPAAGVPPLTITDDVIGHTQQ